MIKKEIPVKDVGTFILWPRLDGVTVELVPIGFAGMNPIKVEWGDIEDMDIIFEKFQDLQMKSFKPVAEALGVMYTNRELYKALM
jgi:hypothetical protein